MIVVLVLYGFFLPNPYNLLIFKLCDPGGILTHENRAVGQVQSGTGGVAENKVVRGAD